MILIWMWCLENTQTHPKSGHIGAWWTVPKDCRSKSQHFSRLWWGLLVALREGSHPSWTETDLHQIYPDEWWSSHLNCLGMKYCFPTGAKIILHACKHQHSVYKVSESFSCLLWGWWWLKHTVTQCHASNFEKMVSTVIFYYLVCMRTLLWCAYCKMTHVHLSTHPIAFTVMCEGKQSF